MTARPPTNIVNNYIIALIWSLPAVVLFFLCATAAWPAHAIPMSRTFGLCLGFASIASFTYRKVPIIGVALLISVASLIIFGFIPQPLQSIYWILAGIFTLTEALIFYRNFSKRYLWLTLSPAFVLIAVLLPYFSLEYSEPFNEVKLLESGVHHDTLYHAAIASMLKTHHVVSHGMHGLGRLEYHFGSHLLMASASRLSGLTVFESYSYFFVFFAVPFLGIMVLSVAEEFLPSVRIPDFLGKLLAYGFVMLGTGALEKGSLLWRFALWPSFESESYVVSLIFLLSLVSILQAKGSSFFPRHRAIAICSVFALMALTKISSAFCALGVLGSWALLSGERWWSKKMIARWSVVLLCLILFGILSRLTVRGMTGSQILPLQFIKAYVQAQVPGPFWLKVFLFVIFHFIFPVAALILYTTKLTSRKLRPSFPAWWALGTSVSMATGVAVLFSLHMEGGSEYYFSNVSMFLALPLLMCIPQVSMALSRDPAPAQHFSRGALSGACRTLVALCVLAVCIHAPKTIFAGAKIFLAKMKQHPPATTIANYVKRLRMIRDDPTSFNTVVYIPRTETAFWNNLYCKGAGYFISAISERPALYAWPAKTCSEFVCGPRFHSDGLCDKSQGAFTNEQLLSEAKRMGFEKVDIVTSNGITSLH